ncbi:hypothetical protein BDV09DRAFT_55250 [Aspergillus tetrazonus]
MRERSSSTAVSFRISSISSVMLCGARSLASSEVRVVKIMHPCSLRGSQSVRLRDSLSCVLNLFQTLRSSALSNTIIHRPADSLLKWCCTSFRTSAPFSRGRYNPIF